jgi:hypothetical protein
MADPIIANVKEQHLEDFAFYFKEALVEYSSLFFTVDQTIKDQLFPTKTIDPVVNYNNRKVLERHKENFTLTVSDKLIVTDRIISIAERKVREKYPEEYDL